jgi:hypothetical protein
MSRRPSSVMSRRERVVPAPNSSGTFLKNSPHGIHAEPCHLRIVGGSWLPERHDEGTKSPAVEAEYGSGLHRTEPDAEVKTTPAGIKAGVARNVWADDNSFLTYGLCTSSDIGWPNGNVMERTE